MRKSITKIKNLIKKVLAAFITTVLCTNGYFGVICSEVMANFQDEDKPEVLSSIVLEKYCNYEVGNDKGTLVQLNVQTGIEYKEGIDYKPIKNTQITLNSPVIEGEYPYSAVVIANSTKATNGKGFVSDVNYSYDAQTGVLQIFTENQEDENGNIYAEMDKNARDSYDVMYYYSSNVYNAEQKARQIQLTGNVSEEVADNDGTVIEKEINEEKEVSENISNVVSTSVWTSDIYNGYIYSNINNGTSLETEYTEYTNVNVSYKEIADEIVINQNSNFVNTKDEDAEIHDVIYKGVKLNKKQIENILGEDFVIEVVDNEGQTITQINKDTETNENNVIEVNYEKEYTNVNFKISKPVKQGYLGIVSKKAIKAEMTQIENNRIKLQQNIISQNNIEEKDETTGEVKEQYKKEVNNYNVETIEEIKDSESKIEVTCDKREITNETKNDVNFTAVLKTNDVKYNLFKNPEIEIEMPSEVDNVILGDVSLLYEDELKIKNSEVQDRNGVKFIKIELEGTQTGYSNSAIFDGANIVIPATIIVNKDIYGTESSIKVRYSNETGIKTSYENEGKDCEEIQINIASMNVQVSEDTNQNIDITALDGVQANLGESYVSLDDLEINLKAKVGDTELKDNNIVYEKEVIKYTVEIKNTSDKSMTNFNIKTLVPEGTTYIEKDGSYTNEVNEDGDAIRNDLEIKYENKKEIEKTIKEIKSNHTWGMDYYVMVDDLDSIDQKTIENKLFVNETETNNINVIAKKGKMKVSIYPASEEVGEYKNMYIFSTYIQNTTNEKITNVKAETILPEEMELYYVAQGMQSTYDEDTRKLTVDVGDIEANDTVLVSIRLNAINFRDGISEYTIPFDLKASGDNTDTYRGDTQYVKAYAPDISVKMESSTEGQKIKVEDNIEYNVTIANNGLEDEYITIIDNLPKEVSPVKVIYEKFEYNTESKQFEKVQEEKKLTQKEIVEGENSYDLELKTLIPKGETINITIIGEADLVEKETEVSNYITVYGEEIGTKTSNVISNIIKPYNIEDEMKELEENEPEVEEPEENIEPLDEDDEDDPVKPNDDEEEDEDGQEKHKISGIAWKDDNKDGIRNSDEEKLKGIKVKLFNAETSSIVVDENNNKKETTTNDNGEYTFENVSKGKYLIIFEYDTNTYTTTKYQVSSASSSENSDAIVKEIAIDGETKTVGVTDSITVKSSNIENIDIGLIESQIFDLKLDKYISKIVVKNSDGTKEYNYNNSQLAKIEIASKKMAESTVVIEYKIVVTNEGEISGKVDEIVDYIPEGLTFSSELNKDWYKGTDGKLRNSTLSQEELKAGESKTLVLTLTKAMTENSTGIVTNAAEITKATNANYVNDKDSTPGNNEQKEDDYSKAQVIISIKTGIIKSAIIIFIILISLFIMIFIMRNDKINNVVKLFIVLSVVVAVFQNERLSQKSIAINYPGNVYVKWDDLWIEKYKGVWQHRSNTESDKLTVENGDESGWICTSPGKHLCNNKNHANNDVLGHLYKYQSTIQYTDWASFISRKYYNEIYEANLMYDVKPENFNSVYVDKNGNELGTDYDSSIEITAIENGKKNDAGTQITGYKYSLSKSIDSYSVKLKVGDNEYDITSAIDGFNKLEGEHSFNIDLTKKINGTTISKLIENEKFSVNINVKKNVWIRYKGINVLTYISYDQSCTCNELQTLERLQRFWEDKESTNEDNCKFKDTDEYGGLILKKVDSLTKKGLEGIVFSLTKKDNNAITFFAETNSKGIAKFKDIPAGDYILKEERIDNSDIQDKYPEIEFFDDDVEIKAGEINKKYYILKLIENTPYYYFKVQKADAQTGELLKGSEIRISYLKDENGTDFETIGTNTTDGNGQFTEKSAIPVDDENMTRTFKIEENKAPENYFKYDTQKIYLQYKFKAGRTGEGKFYIASWNSDEKKYVSGEELTDTYKVVKDNVGNKIAKVAIKGSCIRVKFLNPTVASIGIKKVDQNNTKTYLNGAKFKIYIEKSNKYVYIKSYKYDENAKVATIEWTTEKKEAYEFETGIPYCGENKSDVEGNIILKKVPAFQYYAIETEAPKDYQISTTIYETGEYDKDNINKVNYFGFYNDEDADLITYIPNTKKFINISGMVFLDNQNANKNNTRDDLYKENEDDPDTLLKDVTVILKDKTNLDKNGNPKRLEIQKNMWSDEEYEEIKDMVEKSEEDGNENIYKYKAITVGKNGKYEFKNVPIEYLENCYIEFQYNGLIYQAVKYKDKENGSKVAEKDRQEFNNKYAVIKKSSQTNSSDKSYVDVSSSNGITTTKEYKTGNHKATLQWKMDEDTIGAVTEESYLKDVYDKLISNGKDATEITNVNCGVYLREQANISIVKDIDSIDVSINGKYYTYNNIYNKKNGQDEELNGIETDVGVKFGKKASEMTYSRPIYKADYMWENPDDRSKELQVDVTYMIKMTNNASGIKAIVGSIKDYYDKYYSPNVTDVTAYGSNGNTYQEIRGVTIYNDNRDVIYNGLNIKNIGVSKSELPENSSEDYGGAFEITLNQEIEHNSSKCIYVKLRLSRDGVKEILDNKSVYSIKNVVEITRYGSKNGNGNIYAALDEQSAAGNAIPGKYDTYEGDTDAAPPLKIVLRSERTITGNVFLDVTSEEFLENQVREGNGEYNEGVDRPIGGVKVTLKPKEGTLGTEIQTYTDSDGKFTIGDFIPGDYNIEYEWGGNSKYLDTSGKSVYLNVQDYKSTIYKKERIDRNGSEYTNGTWYKGEGINGYSNRYSDAIDDYNRRLEIDEKLKDIHQEIKDGKVINTNATDKTTMISTTSDMVFEIELKEIENNTYNVENIDFGIVKRPMQSIELNKFVESASLTLANGQVISNFKTIDDGNGGRKLQDPAQYTVFEPGKFVKFEMDKELFQGSTLKVTYGFQAKNTSEIDYVDEDFYKYGSQISTIGKTPVKLTPSMIVDFLDSDWPNAEFNNWSKDNLKDKGILTDSKMIVYANGEGNKDYNVVYTNDLNNKALAPGERSDIITITLSKLLSSGNDDISFGNDAEIIRTTKNGGARMVETIIHGNYKPGNAHESDDSQAENVYVIESTGKDLSYVLPIIITAIMLSVTGIGIVLIKKKVLSK